LAVGAVLDQRAAREQARHTPPPPVATREYRTGRGQRASGTLADGSAFQLGPMSVLRVPGTYPAPNRAVELEGGGYFNVVHDEKHPFSVRTARTMVRDIGTRFIVRGRPDEHRVEVAIAEGKVFIEPGDSAVDTHAVHVAGGPRKLVVEAGQAAVVDD